MSAHGHTVYFRAASVEYYDPAKRPGYPSGFRVEGNAADLRIVWGFYPDEQSAHAAARTLDRLISQYEALDSHDWNVARGRYWRWCEAGSVAEGNLVNALMHEGRAKEHEARAAVLSAAANERGAA